MLYHQGMTSRLNCSCRQPDQNVFQGQREIDCGNRDAIDQDRYDSTIRSHSCADVNLEGLLCDELIAACCQLLGGVLNRAAGEVPRRRCPTPGVSQCGRCVVDSNGTGTCD